ncbi:MULTISPECIES: glycoside hydrolase family 97 protein [unclassified Lentimonas]|uniref:glycoside hydrolase family 97 protein n=1 Tax=unclassified Lentimonas TaxID=2630993 RepID=UPI001321C505|nr:MULTISPECIES: glycoside hydrolase family 97 protein [unclassified Lentimonas]CAA6692416.1 Maltodextrin glucosidase (EC [Lentimonas sp. CC19]CAA6694008.1 Maltodextrin glucosidase (EC [Lentimonas sp. CC10]CAA7072234.1 Maltodextrin glucosidase (EC [Lentimonas sp. CC11]
MKALVSALLFCSLIPIVGCNAENGLISPAGNVVTKVMLNGDQQPVYSISFKGTTIVEPSELGIIVDGVNLGVGVTIGEPVHSTSDTTYVSRGNDTEARDHYNLYTFPVQHTASGREYSLEFRLYDDGVAYRYIVPGSGVQRVGGESSSWKILAGAKTWYFERLTPGWKLKSYAGTWLTVPVGKLHTATPKKVGPIQGTPLIFDLPDDLGYAVVTKAATYNYSGMRLEAVGDRTLVANFTEGADGFDVDGMITTPWRVTMLADDLNELVNSDLIENLNPAPDPELFADTSYIKPGRSAWSWETRGLDSVETQAEFIQLAGEMGFEYSTVDDGWKEWENPWGTMKSLCDLGRPLGVGVFLWVHSNDIDDPANDYQEMRDYFDKVAAAGSVGLKIDFMNGETKVLVDFEIAVLKNAAMRKLLINFHGCHAATGEARTYPNEVTREGIRGIEVNKHKEGQLPASHNAALTFTRFVVGQGDYTPILYTNPGPTTCAHQFATLVTFYSPLQTYAEHPATMMHASKLKDAFPVMQVIPTVWDETIVLPESEIGVLTAMARRSGEDWFVGVVNGAGQRDYTLDLSFLPAGDYEVEMVSDDLAAEPVDVTSFGFNLKAKGKIGEWKTTVPFKVNRGTAHRSEPLQILMAEGGGYFAVFRKK